MKQIDEVNRKRISPRMRTPEQGEMNFRKLKYYVSHLNKFDSTVHLLIIICSETMMIIQYPHLNKHEKN